MASESSDSEKQSLLKADDGTYYSIASSVRDHRQTPRQIPIDDRTNFVFHLRGGRILTFGRTKFNIFLSVITVLTNVMMVVSLPLFSGTVDEHNDEYPVIFFTAIWFPVFFFGLVLLQKYVSPSSIKWRSMAGNFHSQSINLFVGFLNCINGILVVYASDPSRTSPALQALLSTSVIPFTVICRYIFLRKGVSVARLACTGIVLIGLFISLEPEIFNIKTGDSSGVDLEKSDAEISSSVWPFIFVLGFLPLGILNTFIEKQLKKDETESLVFLSWVQFFSSICIGLFFFTDFIPGFGAAGTWDQFTENMKYGARCMYGQDETGTCVNAVAAHWVFVISYSLANLMVFVLVRFAEGAVYLVVVQAITTPLGSLFFTFFKPEPFRWDPEFNITVAFRLAGLCIIVPAVVFYNYFGELEKRRAARRAASIN
ncbi:crt homolog 1-like [Amphiura filiformis]|uniref:crt homolog 1-like n=1 Tax=Amphiura filiformis TaxID=82378 RepID=UPI003B21FDB3